MSHYGAPKGRVGNATARRAVAKRGWGALKAQHGAPKGGGDYVVDSHDTALQHVHVLLQRVHIALHPRRPRQGLVRSRFGSSYRGFGYEELVGGRVELACQSQSAMPIWGLILFIE